MAAKVVRPKRVFDLFVVSNGQPDSEPLLETKATTARRAVSNGHYQLAILISGSKFPTKAQLQEAINRFPLRAVPQGLGAERCLAADLRRGCPIDQQLPWPGDGDILRPDMWCH